MKSQIEEKAGIKIEGKDIKTQWMIRLAAMLPSRFLVGKDGKTAFERRRGRRGDIPTEIPGETVWYKELRIKTERKDKLETEWKEGLWLGHSRNCNEIYIGTRGEVVRAWAIRKNQTRNSGTESSSRIC